LARAINDPEAALRLKAHAPELLERADALNERKGENWVRIIHNYFESQDAANSTVEQLNGR
jgi:hypothetical protein